MTSSVKEKVNGNDNGWKDDMRFSIYSLKAAMASSLSGILLLSWHANKETRPQMLKVLTKFQGRIAIHPQKVNLMSKRFPHIELWRELGNPALESFDQLQRAYKTLNKRMKMIERVEKKMKERHTSQIPKVIRKKTRLKNIAQKKDDVQKRKSFRESAAIRKDEPLEPNVDAREDATLKQCIHEDLVPLDDAYCAATRKDEPLETNVGAGEVATLKQCIHEDLVQLDYAYF